MQGAPIRYDERVGWPTLRRTQAPDTEGTVTPIPTGDAAVFRPPKAKDAPWHIPRCVPNVVIATQLVHSRVDALGC